MNRVGVIICLLAMGSLAWGVGKAIPAPSGIWLRPVPVPAKLTTRAMPPPRLAVPHRVMPTPNNLPATVVQHAVTAPDGERVAVILEQVASPTEKREATTEALTGPGLGNHGRACPCDMCLGNHLIGSHGQTFDYVSPLSYSQRASLHYKIEREGFEGVKAIEPQPRISGNYCGGGSYRYRSRWKCR